MYLGLSEQEIRHCFIPSPLNEEMRHDPVSTIHCYGKALEAIAGPLFSEFEFNGDEIRDAGIEIFEVTFGDNLLAMVTNAHRALAHIRVEEETRRYGKRLTPEQKTTKDMRIEYLSWNPRDLKILSPTEWPTIFYEEDSSDDEPMPSEGGNDSSEHE